MGSCSLSVAVKSVLVMMIRSLVLTTLLLLLSGPLEEVQAVTIRQAEQLQIPPDFNCELCSKCGQSCSVKCALCSGCDLLKAFKIDQSRLAAFGVEPTECGTFCSEGVGGCTRQCTEAQADCQYCRLCQ